MLIWQRAKDLALTVYKLSGVGDLNRDFGLRDQMRRSSVSIASNIAEGDERSSDKDSVRFFFIAKGSLAELRTQIEIAHEIGYLSAEHYDDIEEKCQLLGGMIGKLIEVRQRAKG